jgi:hypothetical protein
VEVGQVASHHEVEPLPGVAAIGYESSGRSHNLSYPVSGTAVAQPRKHENTKAM